MGSHMKFFKSFLKILVVCIITLGFSHQTEAGVGKLVGDATQGMAYVAAKAASGASYYGGKAANSAVSLAAKTFSGSMAALLFVSTKAVEATSYFATNIIINPVYKVLAQLYKLCSDILINLHKMGVDLFNNGIVKAIYNNLLKAMITIIEVGTNLISSAWKCTKVAFVKIFDDFLYPVMQSIYESGAYLLNGLYDIGKKIFNDFIMPMYRFVIRYACIVIDYGIAGAKKLCEHIIKPGVKFVFKVLKNIIKYSWLGVKKFCVNMVVLFFDFVIKCLDYILDATIEKIDQIVDLLILPTLRLISKIMGYVYDIGEFITVNFIVPLFRFIGIYAKWIEKKLLKVYKLFERFLIEIFDLVIKCTDKTIELLGKLLIKMFNDVLWPIAQLVGRSLNSALKVAWHTFLFTTGLLPFMLHKMREVLVNEELDEIDAPDNRMNFAEGAYVNKFRDHTATPMTFAYRNKLFGALEFLIQEKGAQVPSYLPKPRYNKHSYFISWENIDNYLTAKREKRDELLEKIIAIDGEHEGEKQEGIPNLLQEIFEIYNDNETPVYTKQLCLIDMHNFHKRGLISQDELKKCLGCVPYSAIMFQDERFADVLRFAIAHKALDMNGKGFFEVGATCCDNERFQELLWEFESENSESPETSVNDLVQSYIDMQPYPHGIRGICSKFVYYMKMCAWWAKSKLFRKTEYNAKEDFINALYALKRKHKVFNDQVCERRFRTMIDRVREQPFDKLRMNGGEGERKKRKLNKRLATI